MQLLHSSSSSLLQRGRGNPRRALPFASPAPSVRSLRLPPSQAKRKTVDRDVSFPDLYEGIRERVLENPTRGLPVREMYQLVESVKSTEQAVRCLELIQRQLDARVAAMRMASLDASEAAAGAAAAMTRPPPPPGTLPGTRPSLFGGASEAPPSPATPSPSGSGVPPPPQQPAPSSNPYANVRPAATTSGQAPPASGASIAGGSIPPGAGRFVTPPPGYAAPAPGAAPRVPPAAGVQGTPMLAPLPPKQEFNRFLSDWHFRKRYLMRLSVIAVMELKKPEVFFRIVGSMNAFKISPSFPKEAILELARRGAQINILLTAAQLASQQLGYKHKASRSAWFVVLSVMKERGMSRDEMLPVFQALNNPPTQPGAPLTPPQPAQQQQQQQQQQQAAKEPVAAQ